MMVGIDYSMQAPAACVFSDTPQFWCAHQRSFPSLPSLTTTKISFTEVVPRAEMMAQALIQWLRNFPDVRTVYIEDYAYNATGRVFHIGEHAGILKYLLWLSRYDIVAVPPTVVKKFATGKGNADKNRMTSAFLKDYPTAQRWHATFFPRTAATASIAKSPLSDLADAYWIAKYAQHTLTKK